MGRRDPAEDIAVDYRQTAGLLNRINDIATALSQKAFDLKIVSMALKALRGAGEGVDPETLERVSGMFGARNKALGDGAAGTASGRRRPGRIETPTAG